MPAETLEADYSGDVSTTSWLPAESAVADADESTTDAASASSRYYSVNLYLVDRERGVPVFGLGAGAPYAAAFDRAGLRVALDELEGLGLARSVLAEPVPVAMGRAARVSVVAQTSFVSGYGVQRSGPNMIVDPNVAIAHDGIRVELRRTVSEGSSQDGIEVDFVSTRVHRPFLVAKTPALYPSTTPLELQLPIYVNERVTTRSELSDDRVLVFGGMADETGERVFLALVHPRVTPSDPPRTAATASAASESLLVTVPAVRSTN